MFLVQVLFKILLFDSEMIRKLLSFEMKPKRNLQKYFYICRSVLDAMLIIEAYLKKYSSEYK